MLQIALLINSLELGGAEKVVINLYKYLEKNCEIEIICLEKSGSFVPSDVSVKHLSHMTGKENAFKKIIALPILSLRLKAYVKIRKIQVVQSHVFRANYVNILARILRSSHKTQIVIHGVVSLYKNKGILGSINLILIKKLFPLADVIITNTQGMCNDLRKYIGSSKKIFVINNPFDIDYIIDRKSELFKQDEFTFMPKNKYLISIGRFVKYKRQLDLLLAFKALLDKHKNLNLIFLGDGEEKNNLLTTVKKLGISQSVFFLGNVQNPFKYLQKSEVLILTSESESFGNVLVESMICGCPVVSTDCDFGPREIINPPSRTHFRLIRGFELGEYGVLVAVKDVSALNEAIDLMLRDEDLRKKYIARARVKCLEYNINNIGRIYKDILLS